MRDPEQSAHDAIAETLRAIAQSGRGSFLAVLKRCGNIQSPGLMSFPLAGTSLALDFPRTMSRTADYSRDLTTSFGKPKADCILQKMPI